MDSAHDRLQDETASLIQEGENGFLGQREQHVPSISSETDLSQYEALNPVSVLPIPFLAALGMAATAATTIFAYATLLCKDPKSCDDSEQKGYAGYVALSVSIANICSMLVLGSLEKLSRRHRKAGLALWIVCRSMSVAVLALGGTVNAHSIHLPATIFDWLDILVYLKSIRIALFGRVFQGLASDNLLHFNLNSIYVRAANQGQVPQLIGASLALFMIGISIGPAIAGLLHDFVMSFVMAGGTFAISLLYLLGFVSGSERPNTRIKTAPQNGNTMKPTHHQKRSLLGKERFFDIITTILSPLQLFYSRPASIMAGLALLIYTTVQSYIFSLIMVHTSLAFGFTGKQNGSLLSIVHAISASYLFLVLFGIPCLSRKARGGEENDPKQPHQQGAKFALLSMGIQVIALLSFANATQPWQVYVISAMFALGLATPSFIKSHFLGFFPKADDAKAVGALAMMETIGALFSPLILGSWQVLWPGNGVFYGAAVMMTMATAFFSIAALTLYKDLTHM
jgi:hypothetical protein